MHGLLEKERDYRIIENRDINTEEKNIVLFLSLQDLSGSVDELKAKHQFLNDYPIDMLIIVYIVYNDFLI